jgi:glutamate 5-kinase
VDSINVSNLKAKIMSKKILVVKYGSSSLSSDQGIDYTKIKKYVAKLSELANEYQIVVVSSGAVTAGKSIIGTEALSSSIYAMVGSAAIVVAWQDLFKSHNKIAGQILVTYNDINSALEGGRLRQVVSDAVEKEIIPIINENDVLSDIELAKLSYGGDNDGLASKIAVAIGASELLLLTNVDGLIGGDGLVVNNVDVSDYQAAINLADGKSNSGRGGMNSKIEAAIAATKNGVNAYIGNASSDYGNLLDKKVGTHFTM